MSQILKPNANPKEAIYQKVKNSQKSITKLAKKLASSESPLKVVDTDLLQAVQDGNIKKLL